MMTNDQMVQALRRRGIVATPPARRVQSQRKTMTESASYSDYSDYSSENSEPILSEGNQPKDWKALANPRVPWPKNLDPQQVLHELAPFMLYRLFEREAAGRGAPVSSFMDVNAEL
jgi:hypothetical protein